MSRRLQIPDTLHQARETALSRLGEMEFRRLLEKLPAGAYTCDPDGLITYFNQHAVDLWGRAPKLNDPCDRFCGSFKLYAVDGTPLRHDQCWMALALRNRKEYNSQEIVVERPDGRRMTVLAHANPICDDSGVLRGCVNVLVDISDRKRDEVALREADRSKDEFLATLAHELRNPLAPVRNAVQILRGQTASSAEGQWAVDLIERQMQQMTRLIDDLLDVSRITRNRIELRRERVDLIKALEVAVETSRPIIDLAGHELTLDLVPQPLYVEADVTRLAQAIANLLNNAAKYTEHRGHISLLAERQGSDAVITVRDDGIGISPEMLPRIFDMFTQVDRSIARSQGGLGIGLTLVKRLIDLHGGTISARSAGPGKGSEFIVRLPLLIEAATNDPPTLNLGRSSRKASPLRVAIVDDNRDAANSLALVLKMSGHDVRTAYDGEDGVMLATDFRPDVVLLDIGMPRLNGYEAAQAIRRKDWGGGVTLIALTGWGQESDKQRSSEAGFDHHLVKPVDPDALLDLLASVHPAPVAAAAEGSSP